MEQNSVCGEENWLYLYTWALTRVIHVQRLKTMWQTGKGGYVHFHWILLLAPETIAKSVAIAKSQDHSTCARHLHTISLTPMTVLQGRFCCLRDYVKRLRSQDQQILGLRFKPRTVYCRSFCSLPCAMLLLILGLVSTSQPLNEFSRSAPLALHLGTKLQLRCQSPGGE